MKEYKFEQELVLEYENTYNSEGMNVSVRIISDYLKYPLHLNQEYNSELTSFTNETYKLADYIITNNLKKQR